MARKAKTTPMGKNRMCFGEPPGAWRPGYVAGNLADGNTNLDHSRYDNPRGNVGLTGFQHGMEGGFSDYLVAKSMQANSWKQIDHGTWHDHEAGAHDSEHSGNKPLHRGRKPLK